MGTFGEEIDLTIRGEIAGCGNARCCEQNSTQSRD
jgi:hypothetical protein